MKIKQLLGMMALDANANEVGKIDDAEFNPQEGKITAITSTKKLQLKKLKKQKKLKKKWKKLKLKLLMMKQKQKKRLKKQRK